MKLRKLLFITAILMVGLSFSLYTSAAGVRPLVIDLEAQPGETKEFELILTPSNAEETVDISLYQPVQLLNGGLTYQEPVIESFPAAGWVSLSNREVKVFPGTETKVEGTVKVPFDAGGSHTVVLMVEPQSGNQQGGITFKVRYAVRLNIRVQRPGLRESAELVDFGLEASEEGDPIIRARISNPSVWDYLVSGEITIRDSERRLVERVELKTPAGMRANTESTRVYPGGEVEFLGQVTKRLDPGDYSTRIFLRYGEHGQIINSKTITVNEGDFSFDESQLGAFSVSPASINENLKAGQRKSLVLELASEIGETSVITVSGSDVESEYEYSVLEWIQLRSQPQFELAGRGKGRVIMTVSVPRETADASYHGNVSLQAFNPETKEPISSHLVPVSIVVGDQFNRSVSIRSLHVEDVEENWAISLDLENTGNVMLAPSARVLVTDADGKLVVDTTLSLPEEEAAILPLRSRVLTGAFSDIEPGKYSAKIDVIEQGEVIHTQVDELEIAEPVEEEKSN